MSNYSSYMNFIFIANNHILCEFLKIILNRSVLNTTMIKMCKEFINIFKYMHIKFLVILKFDI